VNSDRRDVVERAAEDAALHAAGIFLYASHGVASVRSALHGIRETVARPSSVVVFADDADDLVATYLVRQYLRGRIDGVQLATGGRHDGHCGLDRAFRMVGGDYLVRVDDSLQFQHGWLERSVAVLEADPSLACLSLVPPADYHRGRGRPRTVHVEPVPVDGIDMRCFVTRRDLVATHECRLLGESAIACGFQDYLRQSGARLAYLPGLVSTLDRAEAPSGQDACAHEAELPAHQGASGAMQRLQQAYDLGDDVLLTCLACGSTELEVLAARIRFCQRHGVAIGYWYELRCPSCGEVYYKEDFQFSCPG
jgi:hypothetical protein